MKIFFTLSIMGRDYRILRKRETLSNLSEIEYFGCCSKIKLEQEGRSKETHRRIISITHARVDGRLD